MWVVFISVNYPNSFNNLLRSVYLKRNDDNSEPFFYGFRYKKFDVFKRNDLSECFMSQFTGNCTVHNLKKALQILLDMDTLTYGLFEDTLSLGIDELATSLNRAWKIPELAENSVYLNSLSQTLWELPRSNVPVTTNREQEKKVWATMFVRAILYPILDSLVEHLTGVDLIDPIIVDQYKDKQSTKGWMLFWLKNKNQYKAVLPLQDTNIINIIVDSINGSNIQIFATGT